MTPPKPAPKNRTVDISRTASGVLKITLARARGGSVPVYERLPAECDQITLILTATEAGELADKIEQALLDATPHLYQPNDMCHYCGEPGADRTDQGWNLHVECRSELLELGYDWRTPAEPNETDHPAETPW